MDKKQEQWEQMQIKRTYTGKISFKVLRWFASWLWVCPWRPGLFRSESLLPTLPRQKNKIASQFSTLFLAFHGMTRLEYSATCRVQKCSNFSSNFRFPLQKIPLQQCHTAELVHFIGFQKIRSNVLIKDKASTKFALRDPFFPKWIPRKLIALRVHWC